MRTTVMKDTAKQLIVIVLISNATSKNTAKSQLKLANVFVLLQMRFNICTSRLINNRHLTKSQARRMAVLHVISDQ